VVELQYRKLGNTLLLPTTVPPVSLKTVDDGEGVPKREPMFKRIGNISETALHDFVDITLFLILGALLAALTQQFLSPDDIGALSVSYPALTILSMMGLAIVLCLCSEADAFVAASFTKMSVSAKLSFLVLGPMLDFKLLLMYTRVFRGRLIRTIVTCTIVQVFIYSVAFHYLWQLAVSAEWVTPVGTSAP
jgi:uncharacterized membrane protein YraQ (UPF0718 family)